MSTGFNAAEFTEKVYDVVRMVPRGKVTTYGHVAKLAGYPGYARAVGAALRSLPYDPSAYVVNLNEGEVEDAGEMDGDDAPLPWQRILSSGGWIAERGPTDGGVGANRQADVLRAEGVEIVEPRGGGVSTTRGARLKVSLYGPDGYGWFPARVRTLATSEEDEDSSSHRAEVDVDQPAHLSDASFRTVSGEALSPQQSRLLDDRIYPASSAEDAATAPALSPPTSTPRQRRVVSGGTSKAGLCLRRSKRLRSRSALGTS